MSVHSPLSEMSEKLRSFEAWLRLNGVVFPEDATVKDGKHGLGVSVETQGDEGALITPRLSLITRLSHVPYILRISPSSATKSLNLFRVVLFVNYTLDGDEKPAKRAKRTFVIEVPLSLLLHSHFNEKIRNLKEQLIITDPSSDKLELQEEIFAHIDDELPPIYLFLILEDRDQASFNRPYLGST